MKSLVALAAFFTLSLHAQGSYEVQVYGSGLAEPGVTMFETHSNFTIKGSKTTDDGTLPTHHQFHETLEITHGFNRWFETGFYLFSSAQANHGWGFVGTHIRPRIAVPKEYKLPVGLSLSTEIGYQRAKYSADTWTWEIRPIIDKEFGKLTLTFNPTISKSFHGPEQPRGYQFSPNFKASYGLTKKIAPGFEYYGAVGPITGFDPLRDQQQQFIPCIDLNLSPKWEFNAGLGWGVTRATDHLLFKMILGYRFNFKKG